MHKLVASCQSPKLKESLKGEGDMPIVSDTITIRTVNIHPMSLNAIIEYMYSGNLELTEVSAQPIFATCSFLGITAAKLRCGKILSDNMDASTALGTYYVAERHAAPQLQNEAMSFVDKYFEEVVMQHEWTLLSIEEVSFWFKRNTLQLYM
jgi:hypothetical protein